MTRPLLILGLALAAPAAARPIEPPPGVVVETTRPREEPAGWTAHWIWVRWMWGWLG